MPLPPERWRDYRRQQRLKNPEKIRTQEAARQARRRADRFWKICDLLDDRPTLFDYWSWLKFYEAYPKEIPVGSNPRRVKRLLKRCPLSAYQEKEIIEAARFLGLAWDSTEYTTDDLWPSSTFRDDPGSGPPIIDNKRTHPLHPDAFEGEDDY